MDHIDEIGRMMGYDQNTMNQVKKMIQSNPKMIETMMDNLTKGKGFKPPSPVKKEKRIKPNEQCPCGSGKKYKKCCVNKN